MFQMNLDMFKLPKSFFFFSPERLLIINFMWSSNMKGRVTLVKTLDI